VVQVLRDPDLGDSSTILAAVGQLQFEVFGHRLANEFNAPPRSSAPATKPSAGPIRSRHPGFERSAASGS
jgi:peptide subunit release factor RF-3